MTPPISPEQLQELTQADERERPLLLARKLAALNGFGMGLCAVLVFALGIFDPPSWLLAVVLGVLARTELRGRRLLERYDPSALPLLCRNQVALVGTVWIYALCSIYFGLRGPSPLTQILEEHPDLAEMLSTADVLHDAQKYYRYGLVAFYGLVIVVTTAFQGGTALYYASRRKHLDHFLARTPDWVVEWKRTRR